MKITLNGELRQLDDGATLQQLIERQGLLEKRIAVEINLNVIPRSQFMAYQLSEGDQIEIVHAVGGG